MERRNQRVEALVSAGGLLKAAKELWSDGLNQTSAATLADLRGLHPSAHLISPLVTRTKPPAFYASHWRHTLKVSGFHCCFKLSNCFALYRLFLSPQELPNSQCTWTK